jgi:predicted DNA-binding ribbon-helix-helix protein
MNSPVLKRSVVIGGHKTSVSLEDDFWRGLKEIAAARRTTLSDLVAGIDRARQSGNLSSNLRLFVLESFQRRAEGKPVQESAMGVPEKV